MTDNRGDCDADVARGYDPFDSADGKMPFELWARMRKECPVARLDSGIFYVTGYDAVVAMSKDTDTFTAKNSNHAPGVIVAQEELINSELDGPYHRALRRALLGIVSPRRIQDASGFIERTCKELVAAALGKPHADLAQELGRPLPPTVIAHLMGLPLEDVPRLERMNDEVISTGWIYFNRTAYGEGHAGLPEYMGYLDEHIDARRAADDPPDDIITRLIDVEIEGRHMTQTEIRSSVFGLILAGGETTSSFITSMLYQLLIRPDVYRAVRADRSLVPLVVEEALRYNPPGLQKGRTCARDTVYDGVHMSAGDRVFFCLAAANRDEGAFPDADQFRLDRVDPQSHLAFGIGAHFCIGAGLARAESAAMLNAFADRVVEAEISPDFDPGALRKAAAVQGYRSLPVTFVSTQ